VKKIIAVAVAATIGCASLSVPTPAHAFTPLFFLIVAGVLKAKGLPGPFDVPAESRGHSGKGKVAASSGKKR
jgi:hypothetical protein